jgi:hypothetical protein
MKLITKVIISGSFLAGAAVVIGAIVRCRRDVIENPPLGLEHDDDDFAVADEVVAVPDVGLADVDPEKLTQMGEGIDVDANLAAHNDVIEQRDRLPEPGKNIP